MAQINSTFYSSKEELKNALKNIKDMGFVQTHRNGSTGIGKTLEDLLGIEENNLSLPDLNLAEVKAIRSSDNSMLTLFTKAPDIRGTNKKLVERYGYYSDNNEKKILHSTVKGNDYNNLFNNPFLKVINKDDKIYLQHYKDGIIENCYWSSNSLLNSYNRKYSTGTILLVKADTKIENGKEYFYYNKAFLLTGFNPNTLIKTITDGDIAIDLRIGINSDGTTHDHGTAFRIKQNKLEKYYNFEQIL